MAINELEKTMNFVLASGNDFESIIGLVAVGGFFLTAIMIVFITNICSTLRSVRLARTNADLVNNLANRGFSPEEIERIIVASNGGKSIKNPTNYSPQREVNVPPQKPVVHQHV